MEAEIRRSKPVVRFGVFEVDLKSGEVRRDGLKVKLAEQPFQVLVALLEHPGEVVTREELQQKLWSNDTFVDFDNSLNKAIKKIREALGDSADNPRFVETLARRGYRFIAPVEAPTLKGGARQSLDPPPDSTATAKIQARLRRLRAASILTLLVLLVGVGVVFWKNRTPVSKVRQGESSLVKLTKDTGLTTDPAISPDGKLVAYASDRRGQGDLDIYVQPIAGGEPRRLTDDPADEREPSFSPDGSQIVFRSDRGDGGIYAISAFGGASTPLTKGGRNPRFSPDGKWIVYWDDGGQWMRGPVLPAGRPGTMSIVPFVGGTSHRVRKDFDAARFPIWTPDGKHLLFEGNPDRTPMGQWAPTEDWWVTPLEGGPAVRTGAFKAFRESGMFASTLFGAVELSPFVPSAWSADGSRVIFPAKLGDSWNLWQIPISGDTFRVGGNPERLTMGTGLEDFPSVSVTGQVVFSSLVSNVDIWSLPVDANRGRPTGKPQRLTQNAAYDAAFDVSDDGSKLVFLSNRSGNLDVWLRDLHTGGERQLTVTSADEVWPKMTPDGTRVSYSYQSNLEGGRQSIYVMPVTGGIPEKVCEDCAGPYDWSADGQSFLYRMVVRPTTVGWMHPATGKKVVLLSYPESPVFSPYFSPDYSWISFGARIKPKLSQLFIARFRRATPPSVSEWITVSDGSAHDYPSRWSPDGNLLYFISTRDRFVCLWAQRLDPATKHPLGTAFEVYASHHSVLSLSSVDSTSREFCVTRDQILFNLGELTGNIWMITSN